MNKDINLIFEAYKKNVLLNELDLGGEWGAIGPAVTKGVKEREVGHDTYLFKILKTALNKSSEEVAEILTKPLYDELFPDGRFVARGEQKDQLARLQSTIQQKLPEIVAKLKEDYPELASAKGISSSAVHGYTARILKNFIAPVVQILSDETEGDDVPTEPEVKDAVQKAVVQKAAEAKPEDMQGEEGAGEEPEPAAPSPSSSNKYIEAAKEKVSVSDGGILEKELVDELSQMFVNDNPDISRGSANARASGIVKGLLNQGILVQSGSYITLNDEGDISDSDTADVGLDPEEYAAKHWGTGSLARPTTGREYFGGMD
jgi:hypothetical protein